MLLDLHIFCPGSMVANLVTEEVADVWPEMVFEEKVEVVVGVVGDKVVVLPY